MTPAAAARAIEVAVAAGLGTSLTISWPGVAFSPPSTSAKWWKVDILWSPNGEVQTKGVTGGTNTTRGIVQLMILGPKDQGDGPLYTLADTARTIFNRKRLPSPNTDVMFGAAGAPVPLFEESWRALAVSIPFRVEETVA